jgi:hypothetical protein
VTAGALPYDEVRVFQAISVRRGKASLKKCAEYARSTDEVWRLAGVIVRKRAGHGLTGAPGNRSIFD